MVFDRLARLHDTLLDKGLAKQAYGIRQILAHYVPQEVPGVPNFWRKNYDYGSPEAFYHGEMKDKGSVKEHLDKYRGKGPNMPKKKKKKDSEEK